MDFSDAFRIVNLAVGGLMVATGIWHLFDFGFSTLIVSIYAILFGAVTALLEFQIPPQVSRYASFLFSFLGRGAFYLFMGSILFQGNVFKDILAGIICLAGVIYIGLEFVPSIEPPQNMREADGGWGAEQV